jgi:hypothetical protein
MEEHLYTLLSDALSFPVSWGSMGDGTGTPRVSIYRTGAVQNHSMSGPGSVNTTIQIDCYGSTYMEALTASRAVGAEMNGYRGGPIMGAFLMATRDGIADDAQILQRVSLTYSIWHRG